MVIVSGIRVEISENALDAVRKFEGLYIPFSPFFSNLSCRASPVTSSPNYLKLPNDTN